MSENTTDYSPILTLAYRLNLALNQVKGPDLEDMYHRLTTPTTGVQFVERLAWINNRNAHFATWKDVKVSIHPGSQEEPIPGWDDVRGFIQLTGPLGQIYTLDVTVRGEGRATLHSIEVVRDDMFPKNGKLQLKARQNHLGFWLQFAPKKSETDYLHYLNRFVNFLPTVTQFDEPSLDLMDMMVTALNPY